MLNMNGHDFIPLILQLKDLIFLSDCFASEESEEAELLIAELDVISDRLEADDPSAIESLRRLFSAAGLVHMTALDNGWSEIYDELAEMIESTAANGTFI